MHGFIVNASTTELQGGLGGGGLKRGHVLAGQLSNVYIDET